MGMNPFKNCAGGGSCRAPAPNPDPSRWTLLSVREYAKAYVLTVRYLDATNFEGVKVMVYRGKFPGLGQLRRLDPHFTPDDDSPVARFKPDVEGIEMANALARGLGTKKV